jgi:regulator of nonsense transcripts 3
MANIENLVDFHRHFDGHVFRSRSGVEHQAVVEFAPVQKVPAKAKVKTDARQGTIDDGTLFNKGSTDGRCRF